MPVKLLVTLNSSPCLWAADVQRTCTTHVPQVLPPPVAGEAALLTAPDDAAALEARQRAAVETGTEGAMRADEAPQAHGMWERMV